MLSNYNTGDEKFLSKMREFSAMSVGGKAAQAMNEDEAGQLAKIGYG